MNVKQIINICCSYRNITNKELAEKLNQSPANLNHKLQRDNMKVDEFENILNSMNYSIKIVDNESGKEL